MGKERGAAEQKSSQRTRPRGVAFQEWWMSCGVCGREESMGEENNRAALQEARNRGWVRNRRYGWVCPDDAEEIGLNARGVRPHTFDNPRRTQAGA